MSLYLHAICLPILAAWCVPACLYAQQTVVRTARLVAYKYDKRETGSAFFIDQGGTAVTCYHVIQGAHRIDAFVPGGVRR